MNEAFHQERWYWYRPYSEGDKSVDPWGNEFSEVLGPPRGPRGGQSVDRFYSKGPNGVDENGKGDDIEFKYTIPGRSLSGLAFTWAREFLAALGLLLIGWRFGVALLAAPRSESLGRELARALALSLPPVALFMAVTVLGANLFSWPDILIEFVSGLMWRAAPFQAHPLVALAGSLFFVTYLAALFFRLRARPAGPSEAVPTKDDTPASSSPPFSKLDAAVLGVVLMLVTQASFVKEVWRATSPRMQAVQSFNDMTTQPVDTWDAARDPWGSPWCRQKGMLDGYFWSAGPNRRDENMAGDDIVVDFGIARPPAEDLVYLNAPTILIVGAVLLLLFWTFCRVVIVPRVVRRQIGNADAGSNQGGL